MYESPMNPLVTSVVVYSPVHVAGFSVVYRHWNKQCHFVWSAVHEVIQWDILVPPGPMCTDYNNSCILFTWFTNGIGSHTLQSRRNDRTFLFTDIGVNLGAMR